jgi:carboxyl-terminal processing protease
MKSKKSGKKQFSFTKVNKEIKKLKTKKGRVLIHKISFVISVALIFLGVFFVGFFVGREGLSGVIASRDASTESIRGVDFRPFWTAWELIDEKYTPTNSEDKVSDQDRVWGAIEGMVDSLDDPYTTFLPPVETEDFETTIRGEFSGVGMEVSIKEDQITVVSPLKNTPADRAGMLPEDVILAIDGVSTFNMTLDEAVDRIRGEEGTSVNLTVSREGEEESFEVEIVRDTINIPTLETETIEGDIFVIALYNFSQNAPQEFRNALREFVESGNHKLILDLRGNPGGFLEAAIDMASWYLPAGKPVVLESFGDTDRDEKVFRSKGYDIFNDNLKMVVLVNGGSASASEILAGALQEYRIATVVGSQTFGKGSVQELIDVTDETSLKVTIAQWLTPNGRSISDGGLTPNIVVDDETVDWDAIPVDANGDPLKSVSDLQMEKAIEVLNQ